MVIERFIFLSQTSNNMPKCEMCGKEGELYNTEIEGVILSVCTKCSKHGKVLKKTKVIVKKGQIEEKRKEKPEREEFVVANFAKLIRNKRNKLGKTQKEFAQMLNEKESIIQKIENGSFEPPIKTAKRFEKILNIKLVEEIEIGEEKTGKRAKAEGLTIGDILKLKK